MINYTGVCKMSYKLMCLNWYRIFPFVLLSIKVYTKSNLQKKKQERRELCRHSHTRAHVCTHAHTHTKLPFFRLRNEFGTIGQK
jgi:hypothetical protein